MSRPPRTLRKHWSQGWRNWNVREPLKKHSESWSEASRKISWERWRGRKQARWGVSEVIVRLRGNDWEGSLLGIETALCLLGSEARLSLYLDRMKLKSGWSGLHFIGLDLLHASSQLSSGISRRARQSVIAPVALLGKVTRQSVAVVVYVYMATLLFVYRSCYYASPEVFKY